MHLAEIVAAHGLGSGCDWRRLALTEDCDAADATCSIASPTGSSVAGPRYGAERRVVG